MRPIQFLWPQNAARATPPRRAEQSGSVTSYIFDLFTT
jgi:hypothetical protein